MIKEIYIIFWSLEDYSPKSRVIVYPKNHKQYITKDFTFCPGALIPSCAFIPTIKFKLKLVPEYHTNLIVIPIYISRKRGSFFLWLQLAHEDNVGNGKPIPFIAPHTKPMTSISTWRWSIAKWVYVTTHHINSVYTLCPILAHPKSIRPPQGTAKLCGEYQQKRKTQQSAKDRQGQRP